MKVIIVGAGEVGFHIARRLSVENKDVVVIDKNPDAIRRVSDSIDVQVITGSGGGCDGGAVVVIVETNARPASGMPRPTTNHCSALGFVGFFAADGL